MLNKILKALKRDTRQQQDHKWEHSTAMQANYRTCTCGQHEVMESDPDWDHAGPTWNVVVKGDLSRHPT